MLIFQGFSADNINAVLCGQEAYMDITSIAANTAKSIEDMGNLLKTITNAKFGMEEKLMKADVTAQVANPDVGQNLDVSA